MEPKNIFVRLATLGPVGYLPAPGTMATLVTIPLVLLLYYLRLSFEFHAFFVIFILFVGSKIIGKALEHFKLRDPSEIVFDELIGCFITFCCVPVSWISLFIGFFAFRFFDIFKPFGIKKCEHLYGSLGVVADDVIAGILANLVVRVFLYYLV